ncbi:MAG: HDOD domain-containing protein [Myxococcota bacterium]
MTTEAREQAKTSLARALDEAVSRGAVRVPPYPSTAMKLQAVLAKDDYRTADLVEAMKTDQVFAGNLLRLANSPMYRRASEATSIAAAVTRVGARELTRLAMAAAITHAAQGTGELARLRRRVWRQSLAAAVIAEALAPEDGLDAGEAFVAALLHDVGKLLALTTLEELLARSPSLRADEATLWAEVDRAHVQLGAVLAQRWQLPGVLGAVISLHHDERERGAPLTRLVLRADAVVDLLEQQAEVDEARLRALGFAESAARQLAELLPDLPAFLNALDTEPAPRAAPAPPAGEWLGVQLVSGDAKSAAWPVKKLDARALDFTASAALQPGQLVELELKPGDGGALRFWAVVEHVASHGASFDVRARPFALDAIRAEQWATLVTNAGRAAAA